MRYLLDKNIVRFALVGLRLGKTRQLRPHEKESILFIQQAYLSGKSLFMSDTSFHIVRQWIEYPEVQQVLLIINVLHPTRYHKRWSRRVRETTGLSREDSVLIALATFGSTDESEVIGASALITFDQPMINGYRQHQNQLSQRLSNMTLQLSTPFNAVGLPAVYSPTRGSL